MVGANFEACYREHYPRLVAYGAATTGDRELARELAQEAFTRLHANWERIAIYDQPGAWLRRVMTNLLIDQHRSQRSERLAVERLAARPASAVADADVGPWADLVSTLPPRQRAIVTLHYGEDLSVAEIADLFDLSVNTVKSALAKSRVRLRAGLAQLEGRHG